MRDRRYKVICLGLAMVILLTVRLPRLGTRGAGGLDQMISRQKQKIVPYRPEVRRDVMIEFPILVLGGFRGPLVMGLWIKSEAEKNEQQWWNVKTYHEIIAHLQPNFPSVYVFNAWNLAYNLSVQWHEADNKYLWVLDGARYAQKGFWINPDSPDIMFQLADIYGQKMGRAMPERLYYRQRFAEDTVRVAKLVEELPAEERADLANSTALSDRDKTALLLEDKQGRLELVPIDLDKYPYGVSPFYFDYLYEKWVWKLGPHGQIGEKPMHARPAVVLMGWARSEMLTALGWAGRMVAESSLEMAERGNPILPIGMDDKDKYPAPGSERWEELKKIALFHFDESDLRFTEAIEGFKEHLQKYPDDAKTHDKHIPICSYQRATGRGRKNLFLAICAILENDNKISPEAVGFMGAAYANFEAAIGKKAKDGTYPPESLKGYQLKYYPWPELGRQDVHKGLREEHEEIIRELGWKNGEIIKLRMAEYEGIRVKVDMSLLRLYEAERFY